MKCYFIFVKGVSASKTVGNLCFKLLMTDTDSKTEDFYKQLKDDISEKFDASIFQQSFNIPRFNRKVPRLIKDEYGGKICSEFVGLRAKFYSYKNV